MRGYRLQLEVWYKKYDLETGDSKIADGTFSAEAGHQPEAMKGVQVEIDFDKKTGLSGLGGVPGFLAIIMWLRSGTVPDRKRSRTSIEKWRTANIR